MVSFGQLEPLIRAGEFDQVATALLSVDEPARRALAAPVKGIELHWVEEVGTSFERLHDRAALAERSFARRAAREAALRVAGAGCLPRAADVVSFLRSGRFGPAPTPAALDALVRVLRAPGRPSLAAIARPLAEKLRPLQVNLQWGMISRLLAEAELSPPGTEAVVRGWMGQVGAERYGKDLAELLRADPHTTEMLPHVFGIARLGQELDEEWTKALARLAADGVIDRQSLLDGCVQRLVAGDRPGSIRRVVVLHRLLDPTAEECAARRAECLAMLAGPESTVADLALRGLRRADDAGLVEIDTVAEAAFTVLLRKEKKLVRAQLDWLAAALARKADPLLFEALLTGLGNPAVDLAEQVLRAAATHLPVFGAAGRESLAAAVAGFQGDLRRQAGELLGAGDPADHVAVALPPVAPAAPVPPPIRSIPELAAEVRHMLRELDPDPIRLELALDGLVRFTASDRPALAEALTPLLPQYGDRPLINLLRAVVTNRWFAWTPSEWDKRASPPVWMLIGRLTELTRQMCGGTPPPALLATPATVDGHVDPARVVRLLGEGWEPGPWDLSQALLRLPREIGPEVRAAADRLTSAAGHSLAGFLADGGLPDPEVATVAVGKRRCMHTGGYYCDCARHPARRTVAFAPVEHTLTVPEGLLGQPRKEAGNRAYSYPDGRPLDGWPLVFPSHRELAAAHVQPRLIESAESRGVTGHVGILPALAACDGPFGPAMALCLAYGLTAARPEGRVAAVDAFLDLAARGVLDGALVGRELVALHRAEIVVLKRVADALGEAARAGAAAHAWAALRELVPAVLAAATPGAGAPDLLLTAESVAAAVRATEEIPEVTAVAARGGRTRLVTEATRLARTLASATKTVVPEI
ncbi:hypothetical protein GCM10010112_20330 [Actinoplanes lobatus]|uniref:DUF7825 domain-containing protein n=1 Tax=Actinoplanes lobatus TaxID=113568 RepID=A0A7W7HPH3_9ACTN|nr:DUF6493 family protein [Actinoplanes lobatus]MBB4754288.1 hypothetical protein [Actinoplanes lobatus]GGN62311.1 hypothetical protein GCM10010112_20330 [Actinoplanes lobatus]GIE46028.1 hypothetical protein Alo02nite_89260 [Actinoplanes lobatus]